MTIFIRFSKGSPILGLCYHVQTLATWLRINPSSYIVQLGYNILLHHNHCFPTTKYTMTLNLSETNKSQSVLFTHCRLPKYFRQYFCDYVNNTWRMGFQLPALFQCGGMIKNASEYSPKRKRLTAKQRHINPIFNNPITFFGRLLPIIHYLATSRESVTGSSKRALLDYLSHEFTPNTENSIYWPYSNQRCAPGFPKQNQHIEAGTKWPPFADDLFKCILLNENYKKFRLKFHWSLFLMFQLRIFQHWFR